MITDRRKQAIIEMSKRGTPEEQIIAESIIKKLEISIEDEKIIHVEFKFRSKYEDRLIHQIHSMVINCSNGIYYSSKKHPKTVWFNITKSQELEMNLLYSIYRREFKEEIEITYAAFIQRNNIFAQYNIDNPEKPKDIEKTNRILDRASTIDKTQIRKQIELQI